MKVAIYLFRNVPKADTESMYPLAEKFARDNNATSIELYADGWPSHPNGWDELVSDALSGKYELVIVFNLTKWHGNEEAFTASIKPLLEADIPFAIAQAPFLGVIRNMNNLMAARIVLRSEQYYKDVKSLNIRYGMKGKRTGGAPFGLVWREGELCLHPTDYPIVLTVMEMHGNGLPRVDITKFVEVNSDKVRSIIDYWGERDWQNPTKT